MIKIDLDVLKRLGNACVSVDKEFIQLHNQSIKNIDGNGVNNSWHFAGWDNLYNSIHQIAVEKELEPIYVDRKIWKAIGLFDPVSSELYLVFKKKTILSIMKERNFNHYAVIFSASNVGEGCEGEQLEWDMDFNESDLMEKNKLLLEELSISPEKVVILAFEREEVPLLNAYLFNNRQEIIYHQDYSSLIDVDYSPEIHSDGLETANQDRDTNDKLKTKPTRRIIGLKSKNKSLEK